MEDTVLKLEPHIRTLATDIVGKLDIEQFITDHIDSIFAKLEECDNHAQSMALNADMMFIALTLPVINGIIHVATNRKHLNETTNWIVSMWKGEGHKDPDPVSILSTLVLIYIGVRGWETYKEDIDKQNVWTRIIRRLQKL